MSRSITHRPQVQFPNIPSHIVYSNRIYKKYLNLQRCIIREGFEKVCRHKETGFFRFVISFSIINKLQYIKHIIKYLFEYRYN
jgi:hypothetical protein